MRCLGSNKELVYYTTTEDSNSFLKQDYNSSNWLNLIKILLIDLARHLVQTVFSC